MFRYNDGGGHYILLKEFMIHLREIDIKQVTIQIGTWLKTVICDISDRQVFNHRGGRQIYGGRLGHTRCPSKQYVKLHLKNRS